MHKKLGPGFLEAVYQEALQIEFDIQNIPCVSQPKIEIHYKDRKLEKYYVPDFLAFDNIVIEIKSINTLGRIEEAQIINSIKSCRKELGILINFGELSLNWKRYIYNS